MSGLEAQITKTLPPYMQIWLVAWLNGMKDGTNITPAQFETFRKEVAEMARWRTPLLDEREEFGTLERPIDFWILSDSKKKQLVDEKSPTDDGKAVLRKADMLPTRWKD